ncbi:MAG: AmmeMemoRadiSam system protein B [Rhodocyclaceae bacterium]
MNDIRPAAVAGMFYPGDAPTLQTDVATMLAEARTLGDADSPQPKALIVPHAGYVYSGPVAAHAYARLYPWHSAIRRVVMFGPAHRVAVRGLALPVARAFATPLGEVELDAEAMACARRLPRVIESISTHALEHALEVQLPFLQSVLDRFTLVPFVVGQASPEEVAEVIDLLWGGGETLIVISSDLSHYHPYREAQDIDRRTAGAILALDSDLHHEQACGATPVAGLMVAARRRGLVPKLLDLRNSGDTAGDRSRVVGYGAFALFEDAVHVH